MNMDIYSATPPVAKNAEHTAKNSNSVLSMPAKILIPRSLRSHCNIVLMPTLSSLDHEGSATHVNPAFIALPYTAAISQPIDERITLCITVPHTNNDIQLKWQTSEIPVLAELLKALAT